MTLLGGSVDDLIPQMQAEDLVLAPSSKRIRIHEFLLFLVIISFAYRFLSGIGDQFFVHLFLVGLAIVLLFRNRSVSKTYVISERGLVIPSSWLTQRVIPWDEVVEAYIEEVQDDYGNKATGLRIILDTDWSKVNYSGLKDPSILLLEGDFSKDRLEKFLERINFFKNQFGKAPDTLNQRLKKQVKRAWINRNKRIFFLWIDSSTEIAYLFLLLYLFLFGLTGDTSPLLGIIPVYSSISVLLFIFYWLSQRPYSILGLRPHELGAVNYLPDDVVTNIRFVLVAEPYPVHLKRAEIIYDEGENRPIQVEHFVQIHPETVEPGELAHGIAQIAGNHTQAKGAKITLTVGDEETEFTIPIYWR